VAALVGFLWAAAIFMAGGMARLGIFASLGGQESPYFNLFSLGCGTLLLLPIAFFGGWFLHGFTAWQTFLWAKRGQRAGGRRSA
jgi:hypothetical protein